MKPPNRAPASRRRHLSDEDEALWSSTASTVNPIKRKGRVHASVDEEKRAATPSAAQGKPSRHGTHAEASASRTANETSARRMPEPAAKSGPSPAPPLADFDKRRARKLRSGRGDIERRIDLHGMTQREAHAALRRFLFKCHGEGIRLALVITGKGAPRKRSSDAHGWEDREPGILKRQVPQWLAEPDIRAIVVSYTTAAVQHGGEGALYVHLRRTRGE